MQDIPAPIRVVIEGIPRIKKNGQTMGINRRTGKLVRVSRNSNYPDWARSAKQQLLGWHEPPIDYPINLRCHFYMPTAHKFDLSNMYEGIQDVLVSMSVLKDDHWGVVAGHDGSRVFSDPANPRMEILITKLVD